METERISSLSVGGGEAVCLPAQRPPKKRRINKEEIAGTALASIPLVGFAIFGFVPLLFAMAMAFMDMKDFNIFAGEWVGLANFKKVLLDEMFWEAIGNTFILGSSTIISLVFSLVIAYLLNKPIRGQKALRMIYFVPYVCSSVAISLMWKYMFNTQYGIINQMLGNTGENAIDWLGDSRYFSWAVILMSVWSGMGYGIVLFTAALTGVNHSTVEAATIDGAGEVSIFFHVVFPSISPTTFYLLVMGVIGALQSFATTHTLVGENSPNGDGVTIVFYLWERVFTTKFDLGAASASAWYLSFMILGLTLLNFWGSKKWVSYD